MDRASLAESEVTRRRFLSRAAAVAALAAAPSWAEALPGSLDGASAGVRPGDADQSRALGRALEKAAREGRPLALAPGVYRAANVSLPDGTVLVGAARQTRLELNGAGPLLSAKGARRVALRGVTLDGGNIPAGAQAGVLIGQDVAELLLDEVEVLNAGGTALALFGVGGVVRGSRIENARHAALFSMDGKGLAVTDCLIRLCRNNGVVIRRTDKGDDGSIVSRNRIEDIGALDGGLGWNGNAVNVSKAAGVVVSNNAIRRSAFTAVRAHQADDVMITDNLCLDSGETGLYAEFGFAGAVISGNLVDGAASGISVANFNEGGRLATVVGNVVRNLFRRRLLDGPGEGYGLGIGVEADVAVTGNVVENAAGIGINAGWGPYLRDVTISGNVIRGCDVGVGVSVVEGVGPATVSGNIITGSRRGAVLGYRWAQAVTPDLALGGSQGFPGLTVAQNTPR
ncbi:TIGR03808 family TAT-translocated repetitive protein [Hansschlegelia zhihuaiae]|uniref:TIGR03808 family TAT-translocated repetitive protein n=1 Tax=Hansschlegelia zhihuaiae TaxID=405005 RepID=A0A4Q0ML62_9HYPH|nr:TIGR03808 family TAT-translocated repetitive protein [Hansschlegelia zhihuaiae]RXF74404.1 TIGR03808 family TAT-translocated repetitive protein [Hansschlegelia zhihuaiae]